MYLRMFNFQVKVTEIKLLRLQRRACYRTVKELNGN